VPGLDITKLVAVPPWLQKASFGGVCTSSEVEIPPHRTFASLGFVHQLQLFSGRCNCFDVGLYNKSLID